MKIDTTLGVTTPESFLASGVSAGLKTSGDKDLALVVNQGPADHVAAVFTTNRFQAAPVVWSKQAMEQGGVRAIVLNSGGANACTGPQGLADAQMMAETLATQLGCEPTEVLVASTGLIGVLLDMDKVSAGIATAADKLSDFGGDDAAHAIMTTDTVTKQAGYVSPAGWSIGGMAKGAGMLAPALATMLVVITTDADVPQDQLPTHLKKATSISFDSADSDGCMSTNDTVVLLANGASGIKPDPKEFQEALDGVCVSLAKQLIADAEGAEHAITILVEEAASDNDALEVARSIARSNLFKCAIAGNDPNWGRVLASMGTASATFNPDEVDVYINEVGVFVDGAPGAPRASVDLSGFDVSLRVNLHAGGHSQVVWTNDLTHGYVSENADYSS